MRLTEDQISIIKAAARQHFGEQAAVWPFGSRAHNDCRGGDIDLLVRPDPALVPGEETFTRKIRFLALLDKSLGERKVDVVVEARDDPRPIVEIAHATGVRL